MKFRVTMKDPDGPADGIRSAAIESLRNVDISNDERSMLLEARIEKWEEFCVRWLRFGEYITIEFDTDAGTATVVPND